MHLALGGCLKAPPVEYGITADTGGHIAYILEAAAAQAARADISAVTIVTRLFADDALGAVHARARETIDAKTDIARIATAERRYVEKEALAADLPAFTDAFCAHLAALPALPDVIHAHFADAASVALEARRRFGTPVVYTPHALGIDKRAQGGGCPELDARIAAERAALAEADAVIVSTRDEVERQVHAYGVAAKVRAIAPGVPRGAGNGHAPTIADRLGEWLRDPALPILLAVARPVRKKNLAALVRAYADDPALTARANLVILAGQHGGRLSEEERGVLDELIALAARPGLAGRVALPAQHDGGDVAALYARAAAGGAFVNPALHEPFGLTLIEAAAAGVPVVATRNGGPAEILAATGHGLLVDPRDEGAIAAACRAILDDPVRHAAMARAGRAGVARFDWTRYAADAVATYRALAPHAGRPMLLACDIDDTLTGCRDGARAFAAWRAERRLPFVVATGRSFDEARAVLRRWGLPRPDAYIVDVGTRLMLPAAGGRWRACPDYAAALDRGWDGRAVADALAPLGIAPQPPGTAGPHKLSFFGPAADAARIRRRLAERGLAAQVIHSHGTLIDVIAPRGGKAAAIAHYAARLGLGLGDCVAAGNSGNDFTMLEACGRAIVVGNADTDLATLTPRTGLHRARRHHAGGVLEGLHRLGLAAPAERAAA